MPEVLIWNGCGTCNEAKKNGMCKDNKCIEVSTKKGQKIAKKLNVKSVPQCFEVGKNGQPRKCNTQDLLKKYT